MSRRSYYGRVGYVAIEVKRGIMRKYGNAPGCDALLDFKFSIRKATGHGAESASISVLNLSAEIMNELTWWGAVDTDVSRLRKIELYAGYEDEGPQLIYKGYIKTALPTKPPDRWFNIKSDSIQLNTNKMNVAFRNTKLSDICREVGTFYGLHLRLHKDVRDVIVPKCTINGDLDQALWIIQSAIPMVYILREGFDAVVLPRNLKSDPLVISADNGLMDVEDLRYTRLNIKTRIDLACKMRDLVRVKSEMIPSLSDNIWLVNAITYTGQLRGDPWYQQIECWSLKEGRDRNLIRST